MCNFRLGDELFLLETAGKSVTISPDHLVFQDDGVFHSILFEGQKSNYLKVNGTDITC